MLVGVVLIAAQVLARPFHLNTLQRHQLITHVPTLSEYRMPQLVPGLGAVLRVQFAMATDADSKLTEILEDTEDAFFVVMLREHENIHA